MSKRCELQKEYYQNHGNYKGNGKYSDSYVKWLEDTIIEIRNESKIMRNKKTAVEIINRQFYTYAEPYSGFSEEPKWTISEEDFEYIINKAKEIEMQHLENSYNHGSLSLLETGHGDTFEDYYNETYNK